MLNTMVDTGAKMWIKKNSALKAMYKRLMGASTRFYGSTEERYKGTQALTWL